MKICLTSNNSGISSLLIVVGNVDSAQLRKRTRTLAERLLDETQSGLQSMHGSDPQTKNSSKVKRIYMYAW